ncbi:MAG: hypothetical protein RIQ81_2388, partial [Pseudomonadota bacterium]
VHLVDGLIVRDELVEKPAIAVSESGHVEATARQRMVWEIAASIQNRDKAILEKLLSLLESSQEHGAKFGAASSIAHWIDDNRALTALERLLDEPEWSIRAEVVRSLARKPAERITPLLMKAAADNNPWVRFLAVAEIRFLDSSWLFENLREKILGFASDQDERIRATVIRILQSWPDPAVDDVLLAMARDRDGRVRANAIEGIQSRSIPPEKLFALKANLEDPHNRARANAAVLLYGALPDLALDTLEKMTLDSNNMMRLSAAWALGRLDHERATAILLNAATNEKDDTVRKLLTKSLAGITDRISSKVDPHAGAEAFAKEVDTLAGGKAPPPSS